LISLRAVAKRKFQESLLALRAAIPYLEISIGNQHNRLLAHNRGTYVLKNEIVLTQEEHQPQIGAQRLLP
jgi:hypothetical protein